MILGALSRHVGRRQWHPTPVFLPGKSHGRRSLVDCSPWGRWGSDTTERLHFHFSLSCTGEGNGNPLQCSCLENPRDRGAWWAAVYGVTQSWTQLKWLTSSIGMGCTSQVAQWQRIHLPNRTCGSDPWAGRSPGEENGNPLQYSYLGNAMDRGAWWVTVHRVAKSRTRLQRQHRNGSRAWGEWGLILYFLCF